MEAERTEPDGDDADATPRRKGGGRPLDGSRDQVIRDAALTCLAEIGYEKLTMDQVATRAKAGKGALYRRWPSKAALVIDAVVCAKPHYSFEPTDSLRGDLDAYIAMGPTADEEREPNTALAMALINAAAHDPEFGELLHEQFMAPSQQVLRDIIARAQARGEAEPELDVDLIVDLLPGLFIARNVLGRAGTERLDVRRVVDNIIFPLIRRHPSVTD